MKERITISVDPGVLEDARAEVKAGEAASLSVAVEKALRARSNTQALREAIELAEAEHGPVSKEMEEWATRELMRASREASSSTPAALIALERGRTRHRAGTGMAGRIADGTFGASTQHL